MIVLQVRTTPPFFEKNRLFWTLHPAGPQLYRLKTWRGQQANWWRFSKAAINWLKPAMWFLDFLQMLTGWWFQTFFIFTHTWKWSNLTNIFQMGWNHQAVQMLMVDVFFRSIIQDYELHWQAQVDELSIGFLKDLVPKVFCFESLNIGRMGRQMDRWVVRWKGILWYIYVFKYILIL